MILPRRWVPKKNHEPIVRVERLLAELNGKPQRRNVMKKVSRQRGLRTRQNKAAARDVLRRLGL